MVSRHSMPALLPRKRGNVSASKTTKQASKKRAPRRTAAKPAKAATAKSEKPAKQTTGERLRARLRQAGERGLWVGAAYSDLARVLEVLERLPKLRERPDGMVAAYREARLLVEPHGAPLHLAQSQSTLEDRTLAHLGIARRRSEQALTALQAPVPRKSREAFELSAAVWMQAGMPLHLDVSPGQLLQLSPWHVTMAGEGLDAGGLSEPRLDLELEGINGGSVAERALYHSVVVARRPVRSPVQVVAMGSLAGSRKPQRLEVRAGSRRTRCARAAWRVGLWELTADGDLPPAPAMLPVLLPAEGDDGLLTFVTDNLSGLGESPWTTILRIAQGQRLGVKELAAETGLSERTVTYYVSLATGLAPELLQEGQAGKLSVKLAGTLATVPDLVLQRRLYDLTRGISPEAARITEIHRLAKLSPAELAAASPSETKVARKVLAVNAAVERLAAAPASDEVRLFQAFLGALQGDESALAKLSEPVREALVAKQPVTRRRLPKGGAQ